MIGLPEISLRQFTGRCKGVHVALEIDVICADVGNGPKPIGFVDRKPNSTVRFIRVFEKDTRESIRKKVVDLRKDYGGFEITLLTVGPPDPDLIKGYLKGEKYRSRPTTIVMPNGEPAGEVLEESDEWSDDDGESGIERLL